MTVRCHCAVQTRIWRASRTRPALRSTLGWTGDASDEPLAIPPLGAVLGHAALCRRRGWLATVVAGPGDRAHHPAGRLRCWLLLLAGAAPDRARSPWNDDRAATAGHHPPGDDDLP